MRVIFIGNGSSVKDYKAGSIIDEFDVVIRFNRGFLEGIDKYKEFVEQKAKSGAKVTYWNNYASQDNKYSFDNISFEEVDISPTINMYTDLEGKYYMPKVVM